MKPSTLKRLAPRALGMAALLVLGPAAAKDRSPEDERTYLYLRTPQNAYTVQVVDNTLTSPDFQLSYSDGELRGRAFGRVVFLRVGEDSVGGTVGSQLARLQLKEQDGGTHVQGNFLGTLVNLDLGPQGLSGTVGRCGYDLKATPDGTYEGSRSCGGIPQRPVLLAIPAHLTEQGTPLTVTTLAMLLGSV